MPEPSSGNDPRPRRSLDDETPPPGRDRYEELYRPSESGQTRGQHPLLPPRSRHFQRSLQAPEQPDPDDTYGWLFRDSIRQAPAPRTGPDPGEDAYPMWGEAPETVGERSTEETTIRPALDPTPTRLTDAVAPARRAEVTEQPTDTASPAAASTIPPEVESPSRSEAPAETTVDDVPGLSQALQPRERDTYLTDDVSETARRRWPMILVGATVGLVLVAIVVLVLVFALWGDDDAAGASAADHAPASSDTEPSDTEPTEAGEPEAEEPNPEAGPYEGAVGAIEPAGATAECVADPAKDSAGHEVRYDPALATDGDPATAWRCAGDGVDQELVLTLPEGTTIAEVGLVNGYTKTDPADGVDRYPEYRRITDVTWTFGDGSTVDQELDDGNHDSQLLRIPPVETTSVTLTIRSSTDPGSGDPSRDAVLVSTVALSTPQ